MILSLFRVWANGYKINKPPLCLSLPSDYGSSHLKLYNTDNLKLKAKYWDSGQVFGVK